MIRTAIAGALGIVVVSTGVLPLLDDRDSLPGLLSGPGLGLVILLALAGIACFVLELAQVARRR